jgi:hypothetical protein
MADGNQEGAKGRFMLYRSLLSLALGMQARGILPAGEAAGEGSFGEEGMRLLSLCIGLKILRAEQERERNEGSADC